MEIKAEVGIELLVFDEDMNVWIPSEIIAVDLGMNKVMIESVDCVTFWRDISSLNDSKMYKLI